MGAGNEADPAKVLGELSTSLPARSEHYHHQQAATRVGLQC